jgi:hypothetical protein
MGGPGVDKEMAKIRVVQDLDRTDQVLAVDPNPDLIVEAGPVGLGRMVEVDRMDLVHQDQTVDLDPVDRAVLQKLKNQMNLHKSKQSLAVEMGVLQTLYQMQQNLLVQTVDQEVLR